MGKIYVTFEDANVISYVCICVYIYICILYVNIYIYTVNMFTACIYYLFFYYQLYIIYESIYELRYINFIALKLFKYGVSTVDILDVMFVSASPTI